MQTISPYVMPGIKKTLMPDRKEEDNKPLRFYHGPDYVIDKVMAYFNVRRKDIFIKHGKSRIVFIRQVAHYMLRSETNMSLSEIGHFMNLTIHHTTIIYACRTIKNLMDSDPKIKQDITNIKYLL